MDDVLVLWDFLAPCIQILLVPLDCVAIMAVRGIGELHQAYGEMGPDIFAESEGGNGLKERSESGWKGVHFVGSDEDGEVIRGV